MAINNLEQELTQGIYERDYQVDNSIAYNSLTQTADSNTAFDILNNKNNLPLPPFYYNQDTKQYQEDKKKSNLEVVQNMYNSFKGLASIAADGSLYQISQDYHKEIIQQEKILAQQNFDERNFGYRLLKGIQSDLVSRDVSRLYYEQSELEQQGLDTTAIKAEIAAKEQELAQIPTGADNSTVARGLASFAASMWDMKGILATDLALTAASSAATSIAATGGAAAPVSPFIAGAATAAKGWKYVRPLFTGGASFMHSREVEIGSMLRELKAEGIDDVDAREAAYLYGNVSSAIETLGFFGGADIALGQIKKGIMSLVKSGNKEALQQLVQKKFTKEAILDLAKSFGKGVAIGGIPSALSETGEEGLQGEVAEEVKARLERGESIDSDDLMTYASVLGGAYKRFGATSMEIAEHFINGTPLSEHASQMLDTYYSTFWGSFVGGGALGGTGRLISTMATEYAPKTDQQKFRDAFTNTQKTNGFKEFIRKSEIQQQSPEAGNMITDKLLEANDLPKTLWFAEDALVEIINASQNDEELSALLAPLNLQEKLADSVDGMVEVDINAAKVLFSEQADKVFKQLADNISWSQDALTPKQAKESLARTATDTMFGVQTGTVDSLERKLLESYPEEKRADKTTIELARGNAAVALHIANAMSGATGRSTQEIAEEILNNIVVGDDGMDAVDNVIKNTVLKQDNEAIQLVQQMNDVDKAEAEAGVPMWDKDTIEINGVERAVTNSAGERIAQSEKSLRMFYEWFGDSKVVDEQGRPLVVYHGTPRGGFNTFDKDEQGSNTGNVDDGFFFGDYELAKTYTNNTEDFTEEDTFVDEYGEYEERAGMYAVYLKADDVEVWDFQGASWDGIAYGKYALRNEEEYDWLRDEEGNVVLFDSLEEMQNYVDGHPEVDDYTQYDDPQIFDSTRELATLAKKNGADGLIIKNVQDQGRYSYGGEEGSVYVVFEPNQIKSTSNRGTYSESDNIYYQAIGPNANLTTELRAALDKAEQMHSENKPMEEIYKETGWEFIDGRWWYDTDDSKTTVTLNAKRLTSPSNNQKAMGVGGVKLSEILHDDFLYQMYPFLKDVPVYKNNRMSAMARYVTIDNFFGKNIFIDVRTDSKAGDIRESLLHEIKHAIDDREGALGFSRYPSLSIEEQRRFMLIQAINHTLFKKIKENPSIPFDLMALVDKTKFDEFKNKYPEHTAMFVSIEVLAKKEEDLIRKARAYYLDPDEIRARNASARANLTEEQRRNLPFSATKDVNPVPVVNIAGVDIPLPTAQPTPETAGYFDPATLEIRLTSATNPTTFAHELFHYFMFNMTKAYNDGTMNDEWRKQFEKAMDWAGVKKDANGKYDFSTSNPAVVAAQEKLAEGFTSYIAKGKAPSKQTVSLFNLLKDWFMYAYTSLKRKRVKLNKDVTKFYDQVFSINGDVEARLAAEKIGALSRPEGMTDEDWNKYMELKEQARGAAFGKALEAMVKAAKERLNDAYKAKKKELYEQKLAELTNAPEFIAWKRAKEEGISISSVEDVIGNGKRPYKNFLSETGVHINILVKDSGMQSVAEFVAFINSTKSPETLAEEYAKEQADLWMEERNPELKDIRSENAVRTVASIKVAVMEFMMLKGIPMSQFNTYFNEMKKATEAVIAQSEIRDIANTDKWHSRLINLLDRINVAQSQGDMNKLAQLKWRAAFVNYIIIQSKDLAYQYNRFNKHFSKYKDRPTTQQLKSIEGKVWNLIGDALNRWGLTKRNTSNDSVKKRVDDYIDELLEYGYSGAESIKPYTYLLDNPERIRFKKITTSDFNKLRMVLGQLEILSNMERKIVVEGKELYIKDAVDKVVASAKAKGTKAWNDKSNVVKELFVDFMGIPETQLAEILPSDVFQNFVLEFQNGLSKAERWKNDVSQRLYDILAPVMKFQNREVIIEGRGWKVSELMVMMLNMGNEHNLECLAHTLVLQNKVSPENRVDETLNVLENAQAAISDAGMTGFDIRDVAQQVWDLFDEFVPDMKKAQERLDGKEITMVDAMPYTFLDGKTIRGGYYPARKMTNVGSNKDAHDMTWIQKTFSVTIERNEGPHEIPTDLVLLNTWVSQMSKLLFVTEPANNIEKLANSREFINALGSRTSRYIMDWLNTSIVPDKTSPFFARLSMLSSVYILGGKIVSLPVQMLGIVSAFVNVGYGRCLLSLGKLTTGTGAVQMVKQAKNKSVYMLNRFKNPMNHLLGLDDLGKAITPKLDKTQQSVIKTMMLAVTTGDMLACVTVWDAAYNKALEEGHSEEKAILIADHSVRITQGDTSAGARAKSMRSTLRFLSPFSSFFIAAHNLISSKVIWSPQKRMEAAVALFTLCVLAPLLETLVRAPFEFASMSDDERRRKKVHSITDYIKKRRGRNIAENTINIAFPAFGLAGEVMFYADRGYYSGGTVLPLTSLKKFASLPVDIVNYAKGERSDKAIDNFIDTLGLAIGGINRGNLEKTLRIFNIGE